MKKITLTVCTIIFFACICKVNAQNDAEMKAWMAYMTPGEIHKMLAKSASYYKISFLQTAQMNAFIPLNISPKPDTMLRMFMDWEPLAELPKVLPEPEELNYVQRSGFTLVEWGSVYR